MERKRIMIGVLALAVIGLWGCGSKEIEKTEGPGSGFARTFQAGLIEGNEDSIYFTSFTSQGMKEMGTLLNYASLESGESTVLCGKAECEHNSASCNAWLDGAGGECAAVIGEKIYIWECVETDRFRLLQMELDGSNRQVITEIHGDNAPEDVVFDGDYCYCYANIGNRSNGAMDEVIYQVKLQKDAEPEVVFRTWEEAEAQEYLIADFRVDSGIVYVLLREIEEGVIYHNFYQCDPESGEKKIIYGAPDIRSLIMKEDQVIMTTFGEGELATFSVDTETGERTKVIDRTGNLSYDGTYLYLRDNDSIAVYDENWQEVDHYECSEKENKLLGSRTTAYYLYFFWMEENMINWEIYHKESIGKDHQADRIRFRYSY